MVHFVYNGEIELMHSNITFVPQCIPRVILNQEKPHNGYIADSNIYENIIIVIEIFSIALPPCVNDIM